jgi:hypothetical protein
MKPFLSKLIGYFGFIFLIALLLQVFLSYRIQDKIISDNNPSEVSSNKNAELLFLGNSRCSMHFDPAFFATNYSLRCANLGINGHHDLTMATLQLQRFMMANKAPKYVVLNFDPFTSVGGSTNKSNFVLKDEFARYAFFPHDKDSLYANYFKFSLAEKYLPLYALFKYRQFRNCIFIKNTNDYKTFGYQKKDQYWDTIVPNNERFLKHKYFKKSALPSISIALSALNTMCVRHHIKLLCIQTPVHQSVYDTVLYSATGTLCRQLKIPFVDVNTPYFASHSKLYLNANHLNTYGVGQLNLFLNKDPVFNHFITQKP